MLQAIEMNGLYINECYNDILCNAVAKIRNKHLGKQRECYHYENNSYQVQQVLSKRRRYTI